MQLSRFVQGRAGYRASLSILSFKCAKYAREVTSPASFRVTPIPTLYRTLQSKTTRWLSRRFPGERRRGECMSPPGGFAQSRSPELYPEKLARTWPRFLARRRVTLTTGIAREIRQEGGKAGRHGRSAGRGGCPQQAIKARSATGCSLKTELPPPRRRFPARATPPWLDDYDDVILHRARRIPPHLFAVVVQGGNSKARPTATPIGTATAMCYRRFIIAVLTKWWQNFKWNHAIVCLCKRLGEKMWLELW